MLPSYTFEITTTQLCNMRCTYCFENLGGFLEDSTNLNDYIPNIISKAHLMLTDENFRKSFNGVHFSFWGGESSMNMKMIKAVFDEFHDHPECSFFMYTNGYQMKPLFAYLMSLKNINPGLMDKLHLQFSYDGMPIHDLERFSKDGKTTSQDILDNLDMFHAEGFKVTIKSTLKHVHFPRMVEAWKDIDALDRKLRDKYGFEEIFYTPTIDENSDGTDEDFEEFKKSIIEIAKLEQERAKEGKHLLLGWWNGIRGRCAVGSTMGCLSTDGNHYLCHVGSYMDTGEDKENFTIGNIKDTDEDFLENILRVSNKIQATRGAFQGLECSTCPATNCPKCEAHTMMRSEKENFEDKWIDFANNYKGFCRYWEFFGLVDRALQQKLNDS